MIPSSRGRSLTFLLVSSLAFFGPDLLVPDAVGETTTYLLLSNCYQVVLVILWFWFSPMICQSLVVKELEPGTLRDQIEAALADLHTHVESSTLPDIPVTISENSTAFIFTAGLLPSQCHIFLSSGLAQQLGPEGLRFVLTRALVHGIRSQRLASLLPALAVTMSFNDIPSTLVEWLTLGGALIVCFIAYWVFELYADRQSAIVLGANTLDGLHQMLAGSHGSWLSLKPPARWRIQVVTNAIAKTDRVQR